MGLCVCNFFFLNFKKEKVLVGSKKKSFKPGIRKRFPLVVKNIRFVGCWGSREVLGM